LSVATVDPLLAATLAADRSRAGSSGGASTAASRRPRWIGRTGREWWQSVRWKA